MKKTPFLLPLAVAATVGLSSCAAPYADYYSSPARAAGTVAQVVPCTVISAAPTVFQADSGAVAAGTVTGAAIGAASGSLLGGGGGRVVSTVGFGLLGGILGNAAAGAGGQHPGQVLTVQSDKTGQQYSVTQPIYYQFGEIQAGTHGNLRVSNGVSSFAPDGY